MKNKSLFSVLIFVVIFGIAMAVSYAAYGFSNALFTEVIAAIAFVVALIISSAVKIVDPWDKAFILCLGQFHSLKGHGAFFHHTHFGLIHV